MTDTEDSNKLPDDILAFARRMRDRFGPGVKLLTIEHDDGIVQGNERYTNAAMQLGGGW